MSYKIEKGTNDIVISGWEEGIKDNPYEGIYDMRNCDAVTIPGEVSVAMSTQAMITQAPITTVAFTTNFAVSTSTFTYNGTIPLELNTAIIFTGADLPNGIVAGTKYYIVAVTATTFRVSGISAGSGTIKTFSDNGTGVMTFSTVNMGTPLFIKSFVGERDSQINEVMIYYLGDSAGAIWVYAPDLSITKWTYLLGSSSVPRGMDCYKGYLFVFESTHINAKPIYDTSTWKGFPTLETLTTNNWINTWKYTNGNSGLSYSINNHKTLIGQDDVLYYCNANAIGSIFATAPSTLVPLINFNLADTHHNHTGITTDGSTTITTTTSFFTATDVGAIIVGTDGTGGGGIPQPSNTEPTIITAVIDSKTATISTAAQETTSADTFTITAGATFNQSAVALPSGEKSTCLAELGQNLMIGGIKNYIYPWDRVSPNFSFPIFLSENYITNMVTINTTMYIFSGYRGRIFITNGANATPFYKIADYLSKTTNPYIIWKDATYNRNQLYFSFSCTNNAGTAINEYGGVWAVDVDSTTPTCPRLENQLSYGTYSGYASAFCQNRGSIITNAPEADGYGLLVGWYSGSVGGIDKGISTPYTAGQSYIETDPIPVGTFLGNKTLSGIEYKLAQPLATNESVTISYRTQLSGSYTDNPITQTSTLSGWGAPIFEKSQWVQFKIILTSTAVAPSYCRLREIRLHSNG
jgi:hypothetical protein